ncbi:MAG: endopeptidase La [Bacillota bacterium]|nr:endopeptidase La [Bacillota bacterium]
MTKEMDENTEKKIESMFKDIDMVDRVPNEIVGDSYIDVFEMPVLPLRGVLVYPHTVMQLDVGREKSIKAINEALAYEGKEIILAMQKDIHIDDPGLNDVHTIGTIATIKQVIRPAGGTLRIIVEGVTRVEILDFVRTDGFVEAEACVLEDDPVTDELEAEAYARRLNKEFEDYSSLSHKVPPEIMTAIISTESTEALTYLVASQIITRLSEKQTFLEDTGVISKLKTLLVLLEKETEILNIDKKIAQEVRKQMEKNQREYYLREQIKAISKELGEEEDKEAECSEYREKIKKLRMPKDTTEKALKEVDRLAKMPGMVAEAVVIRNYLDWLIDLPWRKETKDNLDINKAEDILNEDHYGLEEVKERILEYLAVCQLSKSMGGSILCLTGPPGVGKTSLAKSVARALNRKFVRMSLGGVHDEAEIRGHRRTYIGSMPGRIIQGMKDAGSRNPVFLLDEIDKLGNDYKGDPSSALLEVLDPAQNNTFSDHYIEAPFDLSKVLFITTANVRYNIPAPLLDRMEVIELSGYTKEEKLSIAKRHLVPKQLENHSLAPEQLSISDNAIQDIIGNYTREAGVRNLDRTIASVCRKAAKEIVQGKHKEVKITKKNISDYLGASRFSRDKAVAKPMVGVVNGLAWTEAGGEILQVEVQILPGSGKLNLTGKLGDVMKESAQAGITYIRSIGESLDLKPHFEEKVDIHIHVPEGAIPKDGPSAGVTIATALASRLSGKPVRSDVAMTGEITLLGRVLPIGGLKEKSLAAYSAGVKTILLPKENEKDIEKIPDNIRKKMEFHLCETMDDVLSIALMSEEK